MNIEKGLILFQIIMGLSALIFSVQTLGRTLKTARFPKGFIAPPLIASHALLGAAFTAQLAHYIIKPPTDGISIAAATLLFVVVALTLLSLAWNYWKLHRSFSASEAAGKSGQPVIADPNLWSAK
jgi:hypothetical protein